MKKWIIVSLVLMLFVPYSNAYASPALVDISKENTYPNPLQNIPELQPSELTKALLETANVKIHNPDLIKMLNDSTIFAPPTAIGYRASIFLGQFPLNYTSQETKINYEHEKVNTNYVDNRGRSTPEQLTYRQEAQKQIKGNLTARISQEEVVKKMVLVTAMKNTNLPLAFQTTIGFGTQKGQKYNAQLGKVSYLYTYNPAVSEKGTITYGEVYLVLKGRKKTLVVKNVTSQGIGAFIPVQDKITFRFLTTQLPR